MRTQTRDTKAASTPVHIPDNVYELIMAMSQPEPCGVTSTLEARVWSDCLTEFQSRLAFYKERTR